MNRINLLTILSNTELTKMIQQWTTCKISSSIVLCIIALVSFICLSICILVHSPKHFYKKLIIASIVGVICSILLCTGSQLRFYASEQVVAFQDIQVNRQLGSQLPEEQQQMKLDNQHMEKLDKYSKHHTLSLYQKMEEKHLKHQFKHLYRIVRLRNEFNEKNNHIKEVHWFNYL